MLNLQVNREKIRGKKKGIQTRQNLQSIKYNEEVLTVTLQLHEFLNIKPIAIFALGLGDLVRKFCIYIEITIVLIVSSVQFKISVQFITKQF